MLFSQIICTECFKKLDGYLKHSVLNMVNLMKVILHENPTHEANMTYHVTISSKTIFYEKKLIDTKCMAENDSFRSDQ